MAITEVTLKVAAAAHDAVSLQLQFGAEDADVRMRHLVSHPQPAGATKAEAVAAAQAEVASAAKADAQAEKMRLLASDAAKAEALAAAQAEVAAAAKAEADENDASRDEEEVRNLRRAEFAVAAFFLLRSFLRR